MWNLASLTMLGVSIDDAIEDNRKVEGKMVRGRRFIALPGKSHSNRSRLIQKKRKHISIAPSMLLANSRQNLWSYAAQ